VRENRVDAVRIRDHEAADTRDAGQPAPPRPVEEAASMPRRRDRPA
jgi:hypothetical protein